MAAAAEIAAAGVLRGKVTLALVADEEYASIGADAYVQRHRADACILAEPTGGQLVLGHKGFVWARLTTRGRAAHGSNWAEGISAIGKMGRIITALDLFDRDVLRQRVHPLVGPASLHCALIQGGPGISTYAPECMLLVERRTIPGEEVADVAGELRAIVQAAGEEAVVDCYFNRTPHLSDRAEPVAQSLQAAAAAVTGAAPAEAGVQYWTDAAIFAGAGIPTVIYGPSGEGAHAAVEWVGVDSVVSVTRSLIEATYRYCGRK